MPLSLLILALSAFAIGTTEFVNKKAFTEAAFLAVQETMGLPQDAIYLNYSEFEHWGAMGSMK